jgi:hypothetical protein
MIAIARALRGARIHRVVKQVFDPPKCVADLSYVLAWTKKTGANSGDDVSVDLVELPRLRLSFAVSVPSPTT